MGSTKLDDRNSGELQARGSTIMDRRSGYLIYYTQHEVRALVIEGKRKFNFLVTFLVRVREF
jgi:hypothetical protein